VLEAHANLTPNFVNVFQIRSELDTINDDITLLVFFQTVDATNQSGFTRPRRPRDHNTLATLHGHIDVAQYVESAIPLVHFGDLDSDLVGHTHAGSINFTISSNL
jgi:hypothetical protein